MRRALRYFRLQCKRFFKLTPVVLMLSALLLGTLGLAFFGMFSNAENDQQQSLLNIGIVGNMEESYLGMAINALQNLDSSRFSIAVETVDSDSAAADRLKRGELVAYIVLPDDFITEALHGNVQKITCVTSSGASDFGARITEELMKTVTVIVADSQKTVYGFHSAASESGMDNSTVYELGNGVALEVIAAILNRESAYEIVEVGTAGVDAVDDPLLCGMLVLMLMLWGITCCTVFSARSTALNRVLSAKGMCAAAQVVGEYLAYLLFMTVILSVMTGAVVILSRFLPAIPLLDEYDFSRLIPGMLVPLMTVSAMQFFLYEAAGGPVAGALLQFLCAMGTGYVSGCVYPAYFFPRQVQDAAAWLPAWSCRLWLDELLADAVSLKTLAVLAVYFVIFLLLSVILRHTRVRREGGSA